MTASCSGEALREGRDVVELLLELGQRGRTVAIRLLRHVDLAEAQATGVAVDDVGNQEITRFAIEAALDLEVDVDAAVVFPRGLDDLERRNGEAAEARDELRRDVGVPALGDRFFADEIARLDAGTDGVRGLRVRDVPTQNAGFEVELEQRVVVGIVLLEHLEYELFED